MILETIYFTVFLKHYWLLTALYRVLDKYINVI